jgi:hypothetical protein
MALSKYAQQIYKACTYVLYLTLQLKTREQEWTNTHFVNTDTQLNTAAVIQLRTILKGANLKMTATRGLACLYIRTEDDGDITFLPTLLVSHCCSQVFHYNILPRKL